MKQEQYIGVDMAKESFHVCFDDTTSIKKYANTNSGIAGLFREIGKRINTSKIEKHAVRIGVESTAIYHLLLCLRAKEEGYAIILINPLIAHKYARTNIRNTKTDTLDARVIRWCLMEGKGQPFLDTAKTLAFKHLIREREFLAHLKRTLNEKQQNILYKEACVGQSIFTANYELLSSVERKMEQLEKEIKQYRKPEQALLQTIPGVGPLTAAAFISEVQDITKFSHSKKLIGFIGIDPVVTQSGSSINRYRRISKRGNKILRTRLYNAASVAALHDNQFKTFFQKKKDQGKPYRVALVATMNKMAKVIHAVWTRGTPYQEGQ